MVLPWLKALMCSYEGLIILAWQGSNQDDGPLERKNCRWIDVLGLKPATVWSYRLRTSLNGGSGPCPFLTTTWHLPSSWIQSRKSCHGCQMLHYNRANMAAVLTGIPGWPVELRSPLTKAAGDFRQSSAGTGADVLIRPLLKSSLKFSDHAHLSGQSYWHSLPPLYSSSHSVSKTGSTSTIWWQDKHGNPTSIGLCQS